MTRDQVMLLLIVAVGALFVLVHFVLLSRALRARELPRWLRLSAWLPPMTPFVAWRAGAHAACRLWGALGIAYCLLAWAG